MDNVDCSLLQLIESFQQDLCGSIAKVKTVLHRIEPESYKEDTGTRVRRTVLPCSICLASTRLS